MIVFYLLTCNSCTTLRILPQKKIKTVNLKDFGAKGDGLNDDSKALVKALQFSQSQNLHVIVKFNNGVFLFKNQVKLAPNITLLGSSNTIIKAEKSSDNFTLFTAQQNYNFRNITFENITFQGYNWTKNLVAITLKNSTSKKIKISNIRIRNCTFLDFSHALIVTNTRSLEIKNCTFKQVHNCFISLDNSKITISNNRLSSIKNGLLFIDDEINANVNVKVYRNHISSVTNYPIHFSDAFPPFHKNIHITHNTVVGDTIPYRNENEIGSADQISIFGSKNVCININKSIGGGDMGVTITRSKYVRILNNEIAFNDRAGIAIAGGNRNVKIEKNLIYNNGQRRDENDVNVGINLYSNDIIENKRIKIKRNTFFDDQKKISQKRSINFKGENNKFLLKDNLELTNPENMEKKQ